MRRLFAIFILVLISSAWSNNAKEILNNISQEPVGEIAIEKIEQILSLEGNFPEKAEALWLKAQYFYARGDYMKSADSFTLLLNDYPDFYNKNKALYLQAMSSYLSSVKDSTYRLMADSALNTLLLNLEPEDYEFSMALFLKTWFLIQEERFVDAEKQFKKALIYATNSTKMAQQQLCLDIYTGLKDDLAKKQCLVKYAIPEQKNTNNARKIYPSNSESSPLNDSETKKVEIARTVNGKPVVEATGIEKKSETLEKVSENNNIQSSQKPWYLQLGAFSIKANAELLIKNLKYAKIEAKMKKRDTGASVLWIVIIEGFNNRELAEKFGNSNLRELNLDFQARKY